MFGVVLSACLLAVATSQSTQPPPQSNVVGDVTGEWAGEVRLPVSFSPIPLYCVLEQVKGRVSGTAGPSAETQYPITSVTRETDKLQFTVAADSLQYSFAFTFTPDRLQGTVHSKEGENVSDGTVVLTRQKPKRGRW